MENILRRLKESNIRVNVIDDQLKLGVPEDIDATEILHEVRENKQALIALIKKLKEDSGLAEIMPVKPQPYYEVSLQQKAALLGYIYSRVRGSFNINRVYPFRGIDRQALLSALKMLMARHECFRSTLLMVDGTVKQRIKKFDPSQLDIKEIDATHTEDRNKVISSLFYEIDNDHQPIDPEKGPYIDLMMKARLVHFSGDLHALLLSVPHIIADGSSMSTLEDEFKSLYMAYSKGEEPDLQMPSLQMKDYVAWTNSMLEGKVGEVQREYWYRQLKRIPKVNLCSELGYKNPYKGASYKRLLRQEIKEAYKKMSFEEESRFFGVIPVAKYAKGGKYVYLFSKDHQEQLEQLAKNANVSLSIALIATFKLLLFRLTGHPDTVIGLTVTQRDNENLTGIIGNMVNTILLRTKLRKRPTVKQLMEEINRNFNEAYSHNLYPFERLLHETDVSLRSIGTAFLNILTNTNGEIADTIKPGHSDSPSYSQFDFYCQIEKFSNGLAIQCNYQTRIFKAKTIEYIFRHYHNLLEQLISQGIHKEVKKFVNQNSMK